MPLWFSNALKMDGLLAVLRLKWVAWAMYLHPYYIVSNPYGSQAPHPVNFKMSAVALPIGAVMFSFSEESVLNGPPGQWVNPSALLHSSLAEPSTRPVCRVLFVLCPILPMDLGPQRCSRFKQPVRRRLTFGPSEGSAFTSHPWVVMTTQNLYCACVRMRFWISVPSCAHAHSSVCACVFNQFEPHLMVCLSAGSVIVFSIAWRKVAFEAPLLFVCGLLVARLLSVSNVLPWALELANPLIMLLSKIESGVPHWCTPGTVHERSVKELIWNWKDCWEVQIAIAVSPGWENACRHNDRDLSALKFHEHNRTSKSFRSVSEVVLMPNSGSASIVVLSVRIL